MARAFRPRCRGALASALALLGVGSGCAANPEETPRHTVLVTLDTVRADRLGTYGYPRPTSPNLDSLAERGIRFDDAIAHSISTPPSHASILTGLLPPSHGLRKLWGQALAPENTTLAELLRERGFVTAAFVSGLPLIRAAGLAQGFDHYDDAFAETGKERDARSTNARVRAWLDTRPLESRPGGRLFLWVHYFDPHAPYLAPEPQQRDFASRLARHERQLERPHGGLHPQGEPPSPARLRWMSDLYDAEVAATDAALGELLDLLDEAGILSRAVVAAVADHGECLGEGGRYFGHWGVGDEVARVPLVLAHPAGRWAGAAVAGTVRSVDVAPTLLAWLGVPVPAGLDGRDLTPVLEGSERGSRPAYTEQMEFQAVQAVVRGDWRLSRRVRRGAAGTSDLEQRGDGDGSGAGEAARELSAALQAALGAVDAPAAVERAVEPDVAERLKALGYTE